jgi:hypothetical protein
MSGFAPRGTGPHPRQSQVIRPGREATGKRSEMPNKKRYFVLVAVVGVHAVIIGVLYSTSRAIRMSSSTGISMTAFILRRAARPRIPIARPRLGDTAAPVAPTVGPITLTPPPPAVLSPTGQAIDWDASAKAAVATALRPRKRITFGFPTGTSPIMRGAHLPDSSGHHAGDSYVIEGGEVIAWVSDRCYVASDPPPLWEPDILKRAELTHTVCLPPSGPSAGELFKRLPAYKKYHPH